MTAATFSRNLLLTVLLLVAATGAIAVTGTDLTLSARFAAKGNWTVGYYPFWQFFYKIDRIPSLVLGISGLFLAMAGYVTPRYALWKRRGLFLVVLLIIGPGLLVNTVFKQHWGRPRPREVVEFGGTKTFLQPWQKGVSGGGRSFPSGHASAAFYLTSPYFVYRRTNRRAARQWLFGGLAFGVLMSMARITQGGHFLSDCLWAWGVVQIVALILAFMLKPDLPEPLPGNDPDQSCFS